MRNYDWDIEQRTKYWGEHPATKFNLRAKPKETYQEYIDQVFGKPRKLARTASATSLTYIREGDRSELPLKRVPSYSSLSPSHGLYYRDRSVERYIPSVESYKPVYNKWSIESYGPRKFVDTILYRDPAPQLKLYPYFTRVPLPSRTNYWTGSDNYMKSYVSYRWQRMDRSLPFTYRTWDQRTDYRWTRSVSWGSSVFVSNPTGHPQYRASQHASRLFRLNDRVIYGHLW